MIRITTIVLVLLLAFVAHVQGQQKDFVTLQGLQVEKKWNTGLSVSLAGQSMINENSSELWIAFADLGLGYRFNYRWQTELHVREIRFRNVQNTYDQRRLFYHTLTYSNHIGKWYWSVRNRTQSLVYGEHFDDRFKGPRWYVRDKFTLRYKFNYYWSPYLAMELFFPLNNPSRSTIDQRRLSAGVVRTINDFFRIELYLQEQRPLGRPTSAVRYVLGTNFYFIF